jgi:hypothetical protein
MLPESWQAKTLLTPFDGSQLMFAEIAIESGLGNGVMRVTMEGVSDGSWRDLLIVNDASDGSDIYQIIDQGDGTLSCKAFTNKPDTKWRAPTPALLQNSGCICQGENNVLGQDAEAWACQNGETLPGGGTTQEYDWYWFNTASKSPIRFLYSRNNNATEMPVLGEYSMAHLTGVTDSAPATLAQVHQLCTNNEPEITAPVPDPAIVGVSGAMCQGFTPPVWPDKVYSNGALTAVDGSFTSMAIYYDYANLKEVSRILYPRAWPPLQVQAGFINDTRLTASETLEISITPGQAKVCTDVLKNVGIWHPNWAARDGCGCKAGIQAGSPLNPSDTDIHAMSCFFAGSSRIDAWYDVQGAPHMFYESNAGDLDLIDYYAFDTNAAFPTDVFNYPSCQNAQVQDLGATCTTCHGRVPPGQ